MDPNHHSKSIVQVTRNVDRFRKHTSATEEVPIMEVFKKIERMTSQHDQDLDDDLPDTLKMTMENPDISNEPIDVCCEAVKKDDGSVQYECRIVQNANAKNTTGAAVTTSGKFSLNVP